VPKTWAPKTLVPKTGRQRLGAKDWVPKTGRQRLGAGDAKRRRGARHAARIDEGYPLGAGAGGRGSRGANGLIAPGTSYQRRLTAAAAFWRIGAG
jgi:hypothetical protein